MLVYYLLLKVENGVGFVSQFFSVFILIMVMEEDKVGEFIKFSLMNV